MKIEITFWCFFLRTQQNVPLGVSLASFFAGFAVQMSTIGHFLTSLESLNMSFIFLQTYCLGLRRLMVSDDKTEMSSGCSGGVFLLPHDSTSSSEHFFQLSPSPSSPMVLFVLLLENTQALSPPCSHRSWFFKKLSFEKFLHVTSLWLRSAEITANSATL